MVITNNHSHPKIDLSIIIVHYNTAKDINKCLESIYHFTKNINFEIIVIDNASPNREVDEVMKKYPNVIYKPLDKNLGFSAGNNVGLKLVNGEFVILLNPDTYLIDNALKKLFDFIKDNEEITICAPRLINSEGQLQYDNLKFPSILSYIIGSWRLDIKFPKNKLFGRYIVGWWNRENTKIVDVVPGAALMIRADWLKKNGGLDEKIFMFAEDTDLCWRVKKSGGRVFLRGEEKIVHLYGSSATQNIPLRIVSTHAGKLYVIRKFHSLVYYYFYYLTVLFTVLLKSGLFKLFSFLTSRSLIQERLNGYKWCLRYLISRTKDANLKNILATKPKLP